MDLARRIVSIAVGVCLCVCLLGSGLLVLLFVPTISGIVTGMTATEEASPFDKTQLVSTSVATQKYTATEHDLGVLMDQIKVINQEINSPYANLSNEQLLSAPEQYTLNSDTISHLDDCYDVFTGVKILMAVLFVLMLAGIFFVGVTGSNFQVGGAFKTASIIAIFAIVAIGVWAFTSWDTFFAVLHGMFFEDGTWTFSADSLLICMYPEKFWITMGIIWAAITLVLSLVFYLVGRWMRRM